MSQIYIPDLEVSPNKTRIWPSEVREEMNLLKFGPHIFKNRQKLMGIHLTIDDEQSPDRDDAIAWEVKNNGNPLIHISIAHVAAFVKAGSHTDKEAARRLYSKYFFNQGNLSVSPIFPKKISENYASLWKYEGGKENQFRKILQPRPTLTVSVELNKTHFAIESIDIKPTYIQVNENLSYHDASHIIGDPNDPYHSYIQSLLEILQGRFNTIKSGTSYDFKNGIIYDAEGQKRKVGAKLISSHMLIEEAAKLAGHAVSVFAEGNNIPILFRNHELITSKAQSYELTPSVILEGHIKQTRETLTYGKARYDIVNKGHYGIGASSYSHFTSPIRRYSDNFLHRNIVDFLNGDAFTYPSQDLSKYADHLYENGEQVRAHKKRKKRVPKRTHTEEKLEPEISFDDLQSQIFLKAIKERKISPTDLCSILTLPAKSTEAFDRLHQVALKYIKDKPSMAKLVMDMIAKKKNIQVHTSSIVDDGYFLGIATLVKEDETYTTSKAIYGRSMLESTQLALSQLLKDFIHNQHPLLEEAIWLQQSPTERRANYSHKIVSPFSELLTEAILSKLSKKVRKFTEGQQFLEALETYCEEKGFLSPEVDYTVSKEGIWSCTVTVGTIKSVTNNSKKKAAYNKGLLETLVKLEQANTTSY